MCRGSFFIAQKGEDLSFPVQKRQIYGTLMVYDTKPDVRGQMVRTSGKEDCYMKMNFHPESRGPQENSELALWDTVLGELHTSLSALSDMDQMAVHALETEDYKRTGYFLSCMDRISLQAARFAADLRTLLQVERKGISLENKPFDAHELVKNCGDYFYVLNQEKHFSFLWSGDLDGVYLGDEPKIRQIIALLIEDALKNNEDGASIRVEVSRQPGENGHDIFSFAIYNSGSFVNPQFRSEDPDDGEKTLLRRAVELGPGICLAQCIAEAMGGFLRIQSQSGAGTVARLQVVLKRAGEVSSEPTE